MASNKRLKKYRIVKEGNLYYLQSKRWFGWGYVYRASSTHNGYNVRVYADAPDIVKDWLNDVLAGKINPDEPYINVIEEFEA